MRIAICASIDFTNEIKEISGKLKGMGFEVTISMTSEKILNGELTLDQFLQERRSGKVPDRVIKYDILKYYFGKIREADAILVLNLEKNRIRNYIGGATFLEMGFAHVLGKKIFLLNPIPDMHYKDEIKAMQPIILNGDLGMIK